MISVGIRELRQQASKLIRLVREERRKIEITYHGKPVALLVPVENSASTLEMPDDWINLDLLAAEIGARWPQGVSAAEAVAEGRE